MKIIKGLILGFVIINLILLYIINSYLYRYTKALNSKIDVLNDFPLKTTVTLKQLSESTLSDTFILTGFTTFPSEERENSFDTLYIPIYANAGELQVSQLLESIKDDEKAVYNGES